METFKGENFRGLVKNTIFLCRTKEYYAPNFTEKTFVNSHKIAKFVKVFSLKSFPLYGNLFLFQHEARVLLFLSPLPS